MNAEVGQFEMELNQCPFNDLINISRKDLCLHTNLVNMYGQQAGFKFVLDIVQPTPFSIDVTCQRPLCYRIAILYQIDLALLRRSMPGEAEAHVE